MNKGMIILIILLAFLIFGCSDDIEHDDTDEKTEENQTVETESEESSGISMTLATADFSDPEHNTHAASLAFEAYVEEKSKGGIEVIIAAGGARGDAVSIQKQTMEGDLEACTSITEGSLAAVYPDIQAITVPYLFKSVDHAIEVLHGPAGQEMYEDLREATNLRAIGIWDNGGFRCFTNNVRPIRAPDDVKGLNIRTMNVPAIWNW